MILGLTSKPGFLCINMNKTKRKCFQDVKDFPKLCISENFHRNYEKLMAWKAHQNLRKWRNIQENLNLNLMIVGYISFNSLKSYRFWGLN